MKKSIILLTLSITVLLANSRQDAIKAFEKKEYQKSFKLFSKLDSPEAHYYVGKHYYYGYGVKKDITKALKYELIACNENFAKACNGAGWIYQYDKKDNDLALSYYKKGCDLKLGDACNRVGILLYRNHNYKMAAKYYKKACDLNAFWGCDNLAGMYMKGKGVPKSDAKALLLYRKDCNKLKNGHSCNNIGVIFFHKKDYKTAEIYYKKACDLKEGWGCNNLAWLYKHGKGIKQNISKAIEYYKKACDLNISSSCATLGAIYETELRDCNEAIKYFSKAKELNNSYGYSNLSRYYLYGICAKKDLKKAFKLAKKAAELNNSVGYLNMGVVYVKQNKSAQAKEYYQIACEMNNSYGCADLAWLYEYGKGVKKSLPKAIEYYEKACNLGNKKSCKWFLEREKN